MMKYTASAGTLVLMVVIGYFVFNPQQSSARDHEREAWNYQGEITTTHDDQSYSYKVEISDLDRGNGLSRIVHLNPTYGDFASESLASITGHDYNFDGRWDRIFYCGYQTTKDGHKSGCNSVTQQSSGHWEFDACSSDSEKVQPFTHGEIAFAILELDEAVKQVPSYKNLDRVHFWDESEQQCLYAEKIGPPTAS
jgi:hypothetical protein